MIFRLIASYVRSRAARSMAKRFNGSISDALKYYDDNDLRQQYADDLNDCWHKNPSVIKRDGDYGGRLWEMYMSNTGNVYVYFPGSGERRIYTD